MARSLDFQVLFALAALLAAPLSALAFQPPGVPAMQSMGAQYTQPIGTHAVRPIGACAVQPLAAHVVQPLAAQAVSPLAAQAVSPLAAQAVSPIGAQAVRPAGTVGVLAIAGQDAEPNFCCRDGHAVPIRGLRPNGSEIDSVVSVRMDIPSQDPGAARKDDPVPPERHSSVVRFYSLEGDVKADVLRKAISELSTKDVESRIVGDPLVSATRPKMHFVVLETPASVALPDVEKALRKSNARVQALEWTLFRGAKQGPEPILGYSGRDCVIGMSSDMRWFEFAGEASSFYYIPGKLRGAKLEDLYRKLYQPFGGGDLGKLARETFQWSLKAPVDDAVARRAEKAIAKIDGVREAKIDAATGSLRVTVECDGLKTSAPMGPSKDGLRVEGGTKVERDSLTSPRFDTNPIFDVLVKEQLSIAARKG